MKHLTDEQFATLLLALKANGKEPVLREEAESMLLYWNFNQILEYLTR